MFVLGQLAFIVLSNGIGLYHDSQGRLDSQTRAVMDRVAPGYASQSGHAWKNTDELSTLLRRWAQLTGQDQNWSLFAPAVAKATGFPAVVFVWDRQPNAPEPATVSLGPELTARLADHPGELAAIEEVTRDPARLNRPAQIELFMSDNEPRDPQRFLRVGLFRIRRYESSIILYLTQGAEETEEAARERWRGEIRDHVAEYADQMFAYMKWRAAVYEQRHPDHATPHQVILVERVYRMLPPDDDTGKHWTGPTTLPLARSLPQAEVEPSQRPIERFNPVTQRFESVPK